MAKLCHLNTNTIVDLTDPFVIGRGEYCSYVINEPEISQQHCIFICIDDIWFLNDMLSQNSTLLNDLQISPITSASLNENDIITVGSHKFKFFFNTPIPSESLDENMIDLAEAGPSYNNSILEAAPGPSSQGNASSNTNAIAVNFHYEQMEQELTCTICADLFVRPVTINCQHSFCKLCIYKWRRRSFNCPICRNIIHKQTKCMALSNMVKLLASRKPLEERLARCALEGNHKEEYTRLKHRGAAERISAGNIELPYRLLRARDMRVPSHRRGRHLMARGPSFL